MVEANDIVLWAAAFVALWWLFDWGGMRQEGERLPMRRAPLRVLVDVLPKLWRNKSFLLALFALWLIGAAVAGVERYFIPLTPQEVGATARPLPPLAELTPEVLARELPTALPRLVEVPLGDWAALLFGALLVAALIRISIDPPERIGAATARKLRWPAGLLAAYLVAGVALVAAPRAFLASFVNGGGPTSLGTVLWTAGTMVLLPTLLAPAMALLWRLVLEIARGGVWSFVSSMRALAESWLPITLLVLIANALRPMAALWGGDDASAWEYPHVAVLVLLTLTPWVMLDEHTGLAAGLGRSWRLFRQKPVDVIAFGLRFTLLFAVLGGLVGLIEPRSGAEWVTWFVPLLEVVRNALLLLQALVLARYYGHLSEMAAEDEACASCPSTRLAEKLEELTEGGE